LGVGICLKSAAIVFLTVHWLWNLPASGARKLSRHAKLLFCFRLQKKNYYCRIDG